MNLADMQWLALAAAFFAVPAAALVLIERLSTGRLMRCPETGGVAFVDAVPGKAGGATVEVRQCDLWPRRRGCAKGCLARYPETAPGRRVDLKALRPFEPL